MFGGDFSSDSLNDFDRLVGPFYAGPKHMEIPTRLMSLSSFSGDLATFFFTELAARFDVRHRLGDILVPALAIVGQYDWLCPPAVSRALADGIPNGQFVEIPEAGHFPFSEEPDAFLDAVRDFLHRVQTGLTAGSVEHSTGG